MVGARGAPAARSPSTPRAALPYVYRLRLGFTGCRLEKLQSKSNRYTFCVRGRLGRPILARQPARLPGLPHDLVTASAGCLLVIRHEHEHVVVHIGRPDAAATLSLCDSFVLADAVCAALRWFQLWK